MQITFTLQSQYTGATYVAGPFNISGTTSGAVTYELATNVSKNDLANGYVVNTIYETITGGTICSTGECTNCEEWSITPTPTATPSPTATPTGVELLVYGIDLNEVQQNASLYYSVNGGTPVQVTTLTPLPANCTQLFTIPGLTLGDIVIIGTDQTYPMVGTGSSSCPASVAGGNPTYSHTVGVSSGFDYVAFAIDSGASI